MEVSQDILNYIKLIDDKYIEAKRLRVSRFDDEGWGFWSTEMNLEIRAKVEDGKHPQIALLNSILPYWLKVSELLELHHRSRVVGDGKKRKLSKEVSKIKADIMRGNSVTELSLKENALLGAMQAIA